MKSNIRSAWRPGEHGAGNATPNIPLREEQEHEHEVVAPAKLAGPDLALIEPDAFLPKWNCGDELELSIGLEAIERVSLNLKKRFGSIRCFRQGDRRPLP